MPRLILGYFVGNLRTWADQAHFAAQNIVQLRQFINAQFTENAPQARHSRIVFDFEQCAFGFVLVAQLSLQFIGVWHHRAKFVHSEWLAVFADAWLLEQRCRPWIGKFGQQRCNAPNRRP